MNETEKAEAAIVAARSDLMEMWYSSEHIGDCPWWYGKRDQPCTCEIGEAVAKFEDAARTYEAGFWRE
jgi:hypothetical protein